MIFLFFLFGLIIGSFLNALIYRLHSGRSIAMDRSVCPHCKHVLSAADLVPLISFMMLRGQCRYCGRAISWQYPIVELLTGLSFALVGKNYQFMFNHFQMYVDLVAICFLIVIAIYDLKHYLILDKVLVPASIAAFISIVAAGVAQHSFGLHSPIASGLIGVAYISGFFGLQYFVSKGRWIGFGDVKLGVFLGLLFGAGRSLLLLITSYWLGALVGVVLVLFGKKKISGQMPFGTILGFSGIIMVLYGTQILEWYRHLTGI